MMSSFMALYSRDTFSLYHVLFVITTSYGELLLLAFSISLK